MSILNSFNYSCGRIHYDRLVDSRQVPYEDNPLLVKTEKQFAAELETILANFSFTDNHLLRFVTRWVAFDPQREAPVTTFPYLVVDALRRDFFDPIYGLFQAATLLNFWSACRASPAEMSRCRAVPLFNKFGIHTSEGHNLIQQTLFTFPNEERFLKGERYHQFIERMRQLPATEQQFLLVPDGPEIKIDQVDETGAYLAKVTQAIRAVGIHVFGRIEKGEMRMVPSLGMMQALLDVQYQEPVLITPRLYLSTEMQIRECGVSGTRDMMIPFPRSTTDLTPRGASTADNFQAPHDLFPAHDFYHAIIASGVGERMRQQFIHASDIVTTLDSQSRGLQSLASTLRDMEFNDFQFYAVLADTDLSPEAVFWLTLNKKIVDQYERYLLFLDFQKKGIYINLNDYPLTPDEELSVLQALYRHYPTGFEEAAQWLFELVEDEVKFRVASDPLMAEKQEGDLAEWESLVSELIEEYREEELQKPILRFDQILAD